MPLVPDMTSASIGFGVDRGQSVSFWDIPALLARLPIATHAANEADGTRDGLGYIHFL